MPEYQSFLHHDSNFRAFMRALVERASSRDKRGRPDAIPLVVQAKALRETLSLLAKEKKLPAIEEYISFVETMEKMIDGQFDDALMTKIVESYGAILVARYRIDTSQWNCEEMKTHLICLAQTALEADCKLATEGISAADIDWVEARYDTGRPRRNNLRD